MGAELRANLVLTTDEAKAKIREMFKPSAGLATGNPAVWMQAEAEKLSKSGFFSSSKWGKYNQWYATEAREKESRIKKESEEAKRYDRLQAAAQQAFRSKTMFFKDLTFLFQPLLNPTSIWGNMIAARQTFSAFSTPYGQEKIGGGGAMGAMKATALLQGAALAIGVSLMVLRKAIEFTANEIKKAFAFSHALFGASLSSGLGLQFMAQRKMTASTLGVPESEIFRYKQSAQVMRELSYSIATIAKNAPELAYTSVQFKELEYHLLAVGSDIAVKLAPSLNRLATVLQVVATGADVLSKSKLFLILAQGLTGIAFAAAIKNPSETLGSPQSFMRQLPVGAWEKMGLVVGGPQNKALEYLKEIAKNTARLISPTGNTNTGIPRANMLNPAFNMP